MKLVLFDIGGVIEREENSTYNTKQIRIDTVKEFNSNYTDEDILDKWTWEVDGINLNVTDSLQKIEEWFEVIKRKFNLSCTLDEFTDVYQKKALNMNVYPGVISFMNELMDEGINVGLLSNTVFFIKDRIKREVDYDRLSYTFFSYEMGLAKPDIEIFNTVIKETGIEPSEIVFFDDKENNVKNANLAGIHALQVTGNDIDLIRDFVNQHK